MSFPEFMARSGIISKGIFGFRALLANGSFPWGITSEIRGMTLEAPLVLSKTYFFFNNRFN